MGERLKGLVFLVLGLILIYLSFSTPPITRELGIFLWILGLIGVYLAIWKGLVRIIKGEEKIARPPQLVRGKLIEPRACPSCGNVNRLGDRFCRKCGTPLPTVPTEEKVYCTRCGAELKKGAEFCHSCGQAVTRITPPREEIPAVEKVLGGIEVIKDYRYGLYFTPNRVTVAKTGGVRWYWPLLILLVLILPSPIILGGYFGYFGIKVSSALFGSALFILLPALIIIARRAKKKFRELSELSPESILTADKKNFGIPYPDITQVEIKKRRFSRNKITILTRGEKHEFYILRKKESENYVNLIRSVLPNKTYVS